MRRDPDDNHDTTIAVPTSCAVLCIKLTELAQRVDDELAQACNGAEIDYGALEQRVADALSEIGRGLHAQVLARLDADVPAIRVWGDEHTILEPHRAGGVWIQYCDVLRSVTR
jgi:hypothetical protein